MSESKPIIPQPNPSGAYERPVARMIDFYLTGNIGEAKEYQDWNQMLRTCHDHDIVTIHINSNGGDIFTAIQLMKAISDSPATVVASVEGMCMSAATFIFLVADICEIAEHSHFMFHNYSSGNWGKGHELLAVTQADDRWARNLMKKTYKGFFTDNEIEKIIDGRDVWLTPDEVIKKLDRRNKLNKKNKIGPKKALLQANNSS